MTAAEARRKAEACFALARSTTFNAERANAIARGTLIAEKAGLSLDSFDIPGRAKVKPGMGGYHTGGTASAGSTTGFQWKDGRRPDFGFDFGGDDLSEALRKAADRMAEGMRTRGYSGYSAWDGERQQRDADEATRRANERMREARTGTFHYEQDVGHGPVYQEELRRQRDERRQRERERAKPKNDQQRVAEAFNGMTVDQIVQAATEWRLRNGR